MTALNRTAIMVMPGQPFLDWLHRTDPTGAPFGRRYAIGVTASTSDKGTVAHLMYAIGK
jgi:hypothetical protein